MGPMSQPPAYTPATDFSEDEAQNVGGRSTVRTDRVDAELAAIALSIAGIRRNLALIQRDDGGVKDAAVELWCLSAAARIALQLEFTPRGHWEAATEYAANDLVDEGGVSYLCVTAHTAGTFATDYANGLWQVITGATPASGVAFTPPAGMTSTEVQSAISENNTRALSASAGVAAFYGAL